MKVDCWSVKVIFFNQTRAYVWASLYCSSNFVFCSLPLRACLVKQSLHNVLNTDTAEWISEVFLSVYCLFTGPNSRAGACHWSACIHCKVHRHAQLGQVPWARGFIMLFPVLLWLVRRTRTRTGKWTFVRAVYVFHSSETWLELHLFFSSRGDKCLSEQTDLGPCCPM